MAGYWHTVLSGAWEKTYKPLGWDRKKVALALLAIGTIIAAGFRLGWSEMITTAAGYLWIAVPAGFAAIILFVWGIIETQAKLYRELAAQISQLIVEETRPEYDKWRQVHKYTLSEVKYLWCDAEPGTSETKEIKAQLRVFESAIQTKQLPIIRKRHSTAEDMEYEIRNPSWNTELRRVDLKAYAGKIDQDPIFLRDAD